MEHENYKNETMRSQGYEYIASATGLPLDDVKVRSYTESLYVCLEVRNIKEISQ